MVTGLEKVSFHYNPKEGQYQKMFKLLYNCTHFTCCPKSFRLGFSIMWTENFQMYKQDWEEAEEPEIILPKSVGSLKKQEISRKTSISALLTMAKPLTVWITMLLLLSRFSFVRLCATPLTEAHQAPPSLGFSRQEHRSGLPFPSPMHESEKWKWSRSVVSDS